MSCYVYLVAVSEPIRLIGTSPAMERIRTVVARVAQTPLPVLIIGPTGVGKEVVARMLHEQSGADGPFVAVDCGGVAETLLESELFGHEKGAFTGASSRRDGLVKRASGGTFFLDELGELGDGAQTRLLRLLEQGTFRPLGSEIHHTATIRVVAATWRPLREWVEAGRFRLDLYHRLSVIEIVIPPLSERPEDIRPLVQWFLAAHADASNREPPRLDTGLMTWLSRYRWPGNVRELRNIVQYFSALYPGRHVGVAQLPERYLSQSQAMEPVGAVRTDLSYKDARRLYLDAFQRSFVRALLDEHGGNISKAARAADMDRRSIQRILKRIQQHDEPST